MANHLYYTYTALNALTGSELFLLYDGTTSRNATTATLGAFITSTGGVTLAPGQAVQSFPATAPDSTDATSPVEGDYRAINTAIAALSGGASYTIPPGVYRGTITIQGGITVNGAQQAHIRGSDNWSQASTPDGKTANTWSANTPTAGFWQSTQTVTLTSNTAVWGDDSGGVSHFDPAVTGAQFQVTNREQVFFDGLQLTHVSGTTPAASQFGLTAGRNVILGRDPTGHIIEVTMRSSWATLSGANATINGVRFRHSSSGMAFGALDIHVLGTLLYGCDFRDTHGTAVNISNYPNPIGNGGTVSNCSFLRAGCVGVSGSSWSQFLVTGCTFRDSGGAGYDPAWNNGAIKLTGTNAVVTGNSIDGCVGQGVWIDVFGTNSTVSYNRIAWCRGTGISVEVSDITDVHHNVISHCQGEGIFISTTTNAKVHNNVVYDWSLHGFNFWFDRARSDRPRYTNGTLGPATATNASGTTAIFTLTSHGLTTADSVDITGAAPAGYNVSAADITAVTTNTFTLTIGTSGLAAGSGAIITRIHNIPQNVLAYDNIFVGKTDAQKGMLYNSSDTNGANTSLANGIRGWSNQFLYPTTADTTDQRWQYSGLTTQTTIAGWSGTPGGADSSYYEDYVKYPAPGLATTEAAGSLARLLNKWTLVA